MSDHYRAGICSRCGDDVMVPSGQDWRDGRCAGCGAITDASVILMVPDPRDTFHGSRIVRAVRGLLRGSPTP